MRISAVKLKNDVLCITDTLNFHMHMYTHLLYTRGEEEEEELFVDFTVYLFKFVNT